jgi:hypothetical protein
MHIIKWAPTIDVDEVAVDLVVYELRYLCHLLDVAARHLYSETFFALVAAQQCHFCRSAFQDGPSKRHLTNSNLTAKFDTEAPEW